MAENPLRNLSKFGQSIWLDYITRSMIKSGELDKLIENDGISGMTSNPSIFHQAMIKSPDYETALVDLAKSGASTGVIYETLAIEDIQAAADHLKPIYDQTKGKDGFISLEVSPELAYDTNATIEEAKRLWDRVKRPNLMIKVPGTQEGLPAIETLLAEGLNINITLLFSLDNYAQVREVYMSALESRLKMNKPIDNIASVASFFISRIDTQVDKKLNELIQSGTTDAKALLGKAAVASGKIAYHDFFNDFNRARFKELKDKGARVQRPLWASTSTKNPDYSDVLYVEPLIGQDTVNTLPMKTVDAFRDHGVVQATIEQNLNDAYEALEKIEGLGISMKEVTDKLQKDGVQAFIDSWKQLMEGLEEKRISLVG
ncbi:MAG: transaldolase, partial [candidate division Zixibacteria bacterium]|nr:transaldolase [candidate division Zixibacteria bacterium]